MHTIQQDQHLNTGGRIKADLDAGAVGGGFEPDLPGLGERGPSDALERLIALTSHGVDLAQVNPVKPNFEILDRVAVGAAGLSHTDKDEQIRPCPTDQDIAAQTTCNTVDAELAQKGVGTTAAQQRVIP